MAWQDKATKISDTKKETEDAVINSWRSRAKPTSMADEPRFESTDPTESELFSPAEKWDIERQRTPVDGPKGEERTQLPMPSKDIYEGMEPGEAEAIWQQYLNHPDTKRSDGVSSYRDQRLSPPEQLESGYDTPAEGLLDFAGGALWNAPKEILVNALSGSRLTNDLIEKAIPGEGFISRAARTGANMIVNPLGPIAKLIPDDSIRAVDEGIPEYRSDNGPIGDALVTGGEWATGGVSGAKLADKAMSKTTGPVKKYIGKFAASEAGGAYTMDNETINTVIGMNVPGFRGLGLAPDGSFSENRIRQKMNMIQDSLLVGSALGSVVKGGGKTLGYVGNLGKKLFQWQDMDSVQREVVSNLLEIAGKVNDNMSKAERAGIMNDMTDYVIDNIETIQKFGDPDIQDVKQAKDTISLMIDKLSQDPEANARQIQIFKEFRSSALEGGKSPELITKLEQPRKNLEGSLQQAQEAKGGDKAIDQTRDYLQNSADEIVDTYKKEALDAEDNLAVAEKNTDEILRSDPSLNDKIRQAEERNMPFDPYETQNKSADDIASAAKQARDEKWNPQRDERYANVPADSKVIDPEGIKAQFEDVKVHLSKDLQNKFNEAIADGNYKNIVDVAKEISQEARGLQGVAQKDVENFSRYLKNSGDEESVRALKEADEGFRQNEGRFNQGVTQELKNIDQADGWKEAEKTTKNRQAVSGAISDPKRAEEIKLLREQLDGIGAGQKVDDHIIGEAATTISEMIDAKGISKITPQEVRGAFSKMAGGMSPQAKARMENVVKRFEDGRANVKELQKTLKNMQDQAAGVEEEFYGNKLREFFQKNPGLGDKYARNPDGYGAFQKFVSDPKNADRLEKDILPMLDKNPAMKKGAEVAVVRMLEKHLLQEGDKLKIPEGFEKMAEKVIPKEALEGWKILTMGAKEAEAANKTRMGAGFNYNAWQEGAYSSTGTILTWIFGVLNPTSAKIRTITKDYFKAHDPKGKVRAAADEVLANPEVFAKIARDIIGSEKSKMSPEMKQLIFRGAVNSGKDHPNDSGNKPNKTIDQTEEILRGF